MSDTPPSTDKPNGPEIYEIRLKGHLDARWADRCGDMTIVLADNGETLLIGQGVDQAALHGLLKRVRDLGLPLVSVNHVKADHPAASDVKHSTDIVHK